MYRDRLRNLREHLEYSQKKVAKHLDISPASYNHYETGLREPDFDMLKRIARFFHVSIDYLLGNDDAEAFDAMPLVDLDSFLANGKYTIFSHFPKEDDRQMLRDILAAIYRQKKQ